MTLRSTAIMLARIQQRHPGLTALLALAAACLAFAGPAVSGAGADAQTPLYVLGVYNTSGPNNATLGKYGHTTFGCALTQAQRSNWPDPPFACGSQVTTDDTGIYEIGFRIPDGGVPLDAGETITFTAPSGTKFPSHTADYELWWGVGAHDVCIRTDPAEPGNCLQYQSQTFGCTEDSGDGRWNVGPDWCASTGEPPAVDVSTSGNSVTVTLPAGFHLQQGQQNIPAVLVVGAGDEPAQRVVNPPAGTYTKFQWTIFASDSGGNEVYGPGWATNDVSFDAAGPYPINSTLVPSIDRTRVSLDNPIGVTATVRDFFGNRVSGAQVVIEGTGSASQSTTPNSGSTPTTGSDGTVHAQFVDTAAETVEFQADVLGNFVMPQTTTVTFTPGPPDPAHSRLTVSPSTVTADGTQVSQITVDLADQFGNPTIQPANQDTGAPAFGDTIAVQPQLPPSGAFMFVNGKVAPTDDSKCDSAIVQGAGCTNTQTTIPLNGGQQSVAEAHFNLSDTTAEDVTFQVDDLTAGVILNTGQFAPTIHFVAGPPVAAQSTISGPSQPVAADGSTTATITVKLADKNGNPVQGVPVSLQQSAGGHATITPATATTLADGRAVFKVTDTQVENVSFTAGFTVGGQASVVPVPPASGPTVNFVAGGTSRSASTAVASPTSVLANGSAGSTITVSLVDGQGNPAASRHVTLTQPAGAHSTIAPSTATTDASGTAHFTVTDATVESVTYTATDTSTGVTLDQQPTVLFTGTPSVDKSTLSPSAASVPADGASSSTITVTLLDSSLRPVQGKQLCLTQAIGSVPSSGPCADPATAPSTATAKQIPMVNSGCPTQAPAGTTDCNGRARFTVSASAPATVTYGVIDLTDYPSGSALGPHATVTFTTPPSESGLSSVAADPTTVLANTPGADGTSTVTVTLIAPGGTALANHTVRLGASSATATITPSSAQTDANGQAQFAVSDTAVETVTYTATDLTATPQVKVNQTAKVTYIANEALVSTVAADSPSAAADGGATAAGVDHVLVTLDPEHPLTGDHVSLSQSSGSHSTVASVQIPDSTSGCATQAPAGTSDCNGEVEFKVTDATVESVTYTAHDETSGVTLSQQAAIAFNAPPPVITSLSPNEGPVAGGTSVTITGSNLSVGGAVPSVAFGSRNATGVGCASSSSCTATSPAGASAGQVTVTLTTSSGASTAATAGADAFTYLAAAPKVTKISPTRGPTSGGTKVTVTGANFGTLGATTVQFGTATVKPETINSTGTQLTVISPAETRGTVTVTVTTPAGTSVKPAFGDRFTYGSSLL